VNRPHVLIAVPTFTGWLHGELTGALLAATAMLAQHGVPTTFIVRAGTPLPLARNFFVGEALEGSSYSHLCMADSDMSWAPNALLKLVTAGKDAVGVVYQMRNPPHDHVIADPQPVAGSRLLRVAMMGPGLCMLSRRWLMRMNSAFPGHVFEFTHRGPASFGEDVTAFSRWLALGGELFVDPTIRVSHFGEARHDRMLGERAPDGTELGTMSGRVPPPSYFCGGADRC
jgi:hypothetical protein